MLKRIRSLFDAKLLKFLAVGLLNTAVGTGLTFGLYNLTGLGYWLSSGIAYVLASVLSFFLNKHFTFKSQGGGAAQVLKFAANIAVCYFIAYGLAQPLVGLLLKNAAQNVRDNVALLVGMCLFTGLNYLGQRLLVFAGKKGGADDTPPPEGAPPAEEAPE